MQRLLQVLITKTSSLVELEQALITLSLIAVQSTHRWSPESQAPVYQPVLSTHKELSRIQLIILEFGWATWKTTLIRGQRMGKSPKSTHNTCRKVKSWASRRQTNLKKQGRDQRCRSTSLVDHQEWWIHGNRWSHQIHILTIQVLTRLKSRLLTHTSTRLLCASSTWRELSVLSKTNAIMRTGRVSWSRDKVEAETRLDWWRSHQIIRILRMRLFQSRKLIMRKTNLNSRKTT